MKLYGINDIYLLMYKQYCWRNGLTEGQFKNLKIFIEGIKMLQSQKKKY